MKKTKQYFKIALKNVRRRKIRSWLTMIGIFISISTIFLLISISLGLNSTIKEQFNKLGADKFFIEPRGQIAGPGTGGAVKITNEDVKIIEKISGIKEVSYWVIGSAKIENGNEVRFTNIIGIPLDRKNLWAEAGFIEVEYGEILKKGDSGKIDVGYQYYHKNIFKKPLEIGDKITINGENFKIKSNLKSIGNPVDDRIIYISIENFRKIFPEHKDRIDQIIVQVDENQDVKKIIDSVYKKLDKHRNIEDEKRDYNISTPEEILETLSSILNIITGFLIGIAGISLLVGGIGITNTMYTAVLERRKEIGILKSVGAKNSDILFIFSLESGILGLIGGIIGIVIGIILSKTLEFVAVNLLSASILKVVIPYYLIIGLLVFSFLIGVLSGFWPSWKATRISPVEALRYE